MKWIFLIDELKCHSYISQSKKKKMKIIHHIEFSKINENMLVKGNERYRLKWNWIAFPLARQLNGKATRTHNANRRRMLHRPAVRSVQITATNNCLRYRFDLLNAFDLRRTETAVSFLLRAALFHLLFACHSCCWRSRNGWR